MDRQRIKNGAAWLLSVLVTLAFMIAAVPKMLGTQVWVMKFVRWGYPNWFPFAIGSLELLGGILLLIPRLAKYGASLLGVVMVGAAYTHLANKEGLQVLRPVIVLMVLGIIVWLKRPERVNPGEAA
jgi:putative oxidoreductase